MMPSPISDSLYLRESAECSQKPSSTLQVWHRGSPDRVRLTVRVAVGPVDMKHLMER